jgi:hypothetical protein
MSMAVLVTLQMYLDMFSHSLRLSGCAAAWQGPLTEARFRLVDAEAVQQYLHRRAAKYSSIRLVAKEAGYFGTVIGIQS